MRTMDILSARRNDLYLAQDIVNKKKGQDFQQN